MASVEEPVLYWCHQCGVQTAPLLAGEDVLCTFCHQGFVEELVQPGITSSALPPPPSPARPPQGQAAPGQDLTGHQGHRPRILSVQTAALPFPAMMQMVEEMSMSILSASPPASRDLEGNASQPASMGDQPGVRDSRENFSYSAPETMSEDRGHSFVISPTLILHGGAPNLFGSLEVFVDHGYEMGPQMIPNHMRDYFFGPHLDRLIQLLAENDPNRHGTPPAAKAEVERLPKIKITGEHLGSELCSQCAVCKEGFEMDEEVNLMPCKHVYHPYCILPWLEQHNSCPLCRYELPTDDADYEARKGQITFDNANGNFSERQESSMTGGGSNRGQSN